MVASIRPIALLICEILRLLVAGPADLTQDHIHLFHVAHHAIDKLARLLDQFIPSCVWLVELSISSRISLADEALFCASWRTSPATTAKPRPCSPARRFHRRAQRQNIGLEGNGIDQVDNVGHPVRGLVNQAHFAGHLLHHLTVVLTTFAASADRLVASPVCEAVFSPSR